MILPSKMASRRTRLAQAFRASVSAVLRELQSGPRAAVQRLGFRALHELGERFPRLGALSGFETAAADVERPAAAAASVAASGSVFVTGAVAQLSSAPAWQDRLAAAEALVASDDCQAVDALVRALSDAAEEVACAAAVALGGSRKPAAKLALLDVLRDCAGYFTPRVRASCALALLHKELELEEQQYLLELVADRDAEVSIAVIAVVAGRGVAGAADCLLALLEEPSGYYLPGTRLAAARGLLQLAALAPDRCRVLVAAERDAEVRLVLQEQLQSALA